MVKAGGKCESNCLNWANYVATIRGNLERFDDRLRSLHAGCRRFESFIAHISMKNLINVIKSINFNSLLDRANLVIFSIVVLSVGFVGWIPLMLVLQYFSTAYLLYTFVFKVLTKIPGFNYIQLLYIEVITIFPIIDVALKTVNPFYN